jgi:DNA-binding MarR family transcriptional regulator
MAAPELTRLDSSSELVDDRATAEITAAMTAIRRIVRTLRLASRAAEKALGVSGAQLVVLQHLADAAAHADAAPSIAELATKTATDPSSVSVVVSRLCARGLAARRVSKLDGRRAEIGITPSGRALLRRAPTPVQTRMILALSKLPASRRRETVAALEAMVNELGPDEGTEDMLDAEDR